MSAISTSNARVIGNERAGEWLRSRPGERFWIRIPASETNGSYSVMEILSSPTAIHRRPILGLRCVVGRGEGPC